MVLILITIGTLSYSNTFSASFHFDDYRRIVSNSHIKDFSTFGQQWGSRYVGYLTFALNYRFGDLNVVGYHLVNLIIHVGNSFLVYLLVRSCLATLGAQAATTTQGSARDRWIALLCAALFIAHPIQTGAVTYIIQRFTILATFFYLLSVVCYLQWRLRKASAWYGGALVAALLAMQTKEISFTLPFVLLIFEWACFPPATWKRWITLGPFFLFLPIIPLSLSGPLGQETTDFARETSELSRMSYFMTQLPVIVTYLRLLVWPVGQNVDYDYPVYHSFFEFAVIGSLIVLLAFFAISILLLRSHSRFRLAGLGILWFFVTLSVESSLIPIRDVIFEHRVYLPSVGLFLAMTLVGAQLLESQQRLAMGLGAAVVVVLALATYQRNNVWQDDRSLWSDVVAKSPMKARGHNGLGHAYLEEDLLDGFFRLFRG